MKQNVKYKLTKIKKQNELINTENTLYLKTRKEQKGITLIALVITIIVLLILAGVSIATLTGENGILNRAKDASKKTQFASEKEAIEFIMSDIKTSLMIGEEIPKSKYLGKALSKRTLGNTTQWGVVTVDGKNYTNGWYLLEKGNEIEGYGEVKQSWLINYDTGEIIGLEEGKYSKLSAEDIENQVAKENLIFNLDSNLIDMAKNENGDVTKNSFENLLDENSQLVNFNWNGTTSGVTKTSFKFDGIDDYAKVKYDNKDKKELIKNNGFTFEFYGKWKYGSLITGEGSIENSFGRGGLFNFGNENPVNLTDMGIRCLLQYSDNDEKYFTWSGDWGNGGTNDPKFVSDYTEEGTRHAVKLPLNDTISKNIDKNEDIFLTFSINTSESIDVNGVDYYISGLYENGKKIIEAKYSKSAWDAFLDSPGWKDSSLFQIGRVMAVSNGHWAYSTLDVYALRLYNKGLSDGDIMKSYDDTVAAHNKLVADSTN